MAEKMNYFNELAKLNVNDHVEKKGKFSYLSWPYAVAELKKRYPEATWEVKRFGSEELPYLKTEVGYFVEVPVTVEGLTLSQLHPVLDNNNRPIKQPDSFQINTSIQRALVKSIALHGLGLYIYAGEDLPDNDEEGEPDSKKTASATTSVPSAREQAIEAAKAKAAAAKEEKEISASENVNESVVEPINEAQLKVIVNTLELIGKKLKGKFNKEEFVTELLSKFGKSSLTQLSFDQAKEVSGELNAYFRTVKQ